MSSINTGSINANFPVSKANNSSQGFRDNFAAIKTNLNTAASEITTLQTNVTTLQTTVGNLSQPDTAEVLTAVSGSDTIIATSGKIFTAYATGQRFQFKPSTSNTTSSVTININSKGAKSIKYSDATDLPIGSLTTSQWITIEYDGTNFVILGSSGFTQNGTNATTRTVQNKLSDVVSVKDFGAIGNGIANDTAAIQYALNTGKNVVGVPGETYLIAPLTQSTNDQVIDFTGCTLKRVNSSAHAAMLSLAGLRAQVIGGRWDGNKTNQSGTVNDQYAHAAVTLTGDYTVVEGIESFNSWGIGIKGQNASYTSIRFNRCIDAELFGIFFECTSSDEYGNEILDNYVSSVGLPNVSGIYLTGTNDFLINQYFWKVCRNTVQCSQDASVTGICITTRGFDGVCNDNNTTGGTMGISGDSATRSTFSGNRCSDTSGLSDYGIEINAALCTVVGNSIENTKWGISISGAVFNQNYTTISSNVINSRNGGIGIYALGQVSGVKTITGATSANPIQFTSVGHGLTTGNFVTFTELPGAFSALNGQQYRVTVTGSNTFTVVVNGAAFAAYTSGGKALRGVAQYLNIIGNTIKFNAPGALTGGGGTGIYLAGRTEYSSISGNLFVGPGKAIPDGNGVFLDNTGGYCSVIGNRFSGFTTPLGLYSGGISTFTDVTFNSNDCTYDCPSPDSLVGVSGGATLGARVTQMWNNTSGGVNGNTLDTASKLNLTWTDGIPTPESRFSGALGSLFVNPGYGEGNLLYLKESAPTTSVSAATSANPIQITTGSAHGLAGGIKNINGATSANPIQFTTTTAHNFKTGIFVTVAGLPGSFGVLNGASYQITVTGANTFTIPFNGSAFAAYTSGGSATPPTFNVTFRGMPGSFAFLNDKAFPVTVVNSTTFTVPVDGSGYATYTTGGSVENASEGWIPVNAASTSFANLNDATSQINTLRKRYNRQVIDTTNNRPYFATGAAASDPWLSFDGQLSLTPGSGAVGRGSFAARAPSSVNAATYTVATQDYSLRFTTTNCTLTLPTAAGSAGRILMLSTITANSVTSNASNVVPLGSNTAGTAILPATAGKFAMLQSDGSLWYVLMAN